MALGFYSFTQYKTLLRYYKTMILYGWLLIHSIQDTTEYYKTMIFCVFFIFLNQHLQDKGNYDCSR